MQCELAGQRFCQQAQVRDLVLVLEAPDGAPDVPSLLEELRGVPSPTCQETRSTAGTQLLSHHPQVMKRKVHRPRARWGQNSMEAGLSLPRNTG